MAQNFKTIMIRVKNDIISESYAEYCRESWEFVGIRFYDAVTPLTLDQQDLKLKFGRKNNKELTDTEKACFYSQYNMWKKCADENVPILLLEHDALCVNRAAIEFNPNLAVQFFGQHAMEAVMYHPKFAQRIIAHCQGDHWVTGPMKLVDALLGYFNPGAQSRYGLPHARYQGKLAPVRSVIDDRYGTTVKHFNGSTTLNRVVGNGKDRDLFEMIDLRPTKHIVEKDFILRGIHPAKWHMGLGHAPRTSQG